MPVTVNLCRRAALMLLLAAGGVATPTASSAHPMPDTEITVVRGTERLRLTIRVPLDDLRLAIGEPSQRLTTTDGASSSKHLRKYFERHARLIKSNGTPVPMVIEAVRVTTDRNNDVGTYRELVVETSALIRSAEQVVLAYDGVLHQVANHRARVMDASGKLIGIIRFSMAEKRATRVAIPAR